MEENLMAKYCGKCGTEINTAVAFCPNCGEKIDNNIPNANVGYTAVKPKTFSIKSLIPIIGIIAVITIIIVLITSLGGKGYKKVLDNHFKAYTTNDPDLMYESVKAQYWIDYVEEASGDSYAFEYIVEEIEDNLEEWDCGENINIKYEILHETRATKEDLEEIEEDIYDTYAYFVYDRDEFSITDAYLIDVNFTVTGDSGSEELHYPKGLLIIKENGKWKMATGVITTRLYDNG